MKKIDRDKIKFLEVLEKNGGFKYKAIKKLGKTPDTFRRWMRDDEEFAQKVDEIQGVKDDDVENRLHSLIKSGDTASTIFYCKTKLKHRGYTDKFIKPDTEQSKEQVETNLKDLKRKVESKKKYLISLLKKENKYTPDLSMQVTEAARLLVLEDNILEQMSLNPSEVITTEISREGNERKDVSPVYTAYLRFSEAAQKALRALGMNKDSKDHGTPADGLGAFLDKVDSI